MKWFINTSIRNKLFIVFGLMLFLIAIVIFSAYAGLNASRQAQQILINVDFPYTLEVTKLQSNLNRERVVLRRMIDAVTPADQVLWHQDIEELDAEIDEGLRMISSLELSDKTLLNIIEELRVSRQNYIEMRETQMVPLIYEGKLPEARALFFGELLQQYETMRRTADLSSRVANARVHNLAVWIAQVYQITIIAYLVIGSLSGGLAIVFSIYLVKLIAAPLKELATQAEKVAYGDYTVSLSPVNRSDEVGALRLSFGMMLGSLRAVTMEVRGLTQAITGSIAAMSESLEGGLPGEDSRNESVRAIAQNLEEAGRKLQDLVKEYKL